MQRIIRFYISVFKGESRKCRDTRWRKKSKLKNRASILSAKEEAAGSLQRTMAFGFCGAVLLLVLISLIMPDRSFSEEENRVLSKQPKFGVTEVMNKEYMEGLESYTSDQFIFRDLWIKLKVQCDLLTGKRELNGVYLGKDKYLMQAISEPDQEHVKENIKGMNAFAARHQDLNINAMIVPNAAYVMQDYLPKGAPVRDQGKDMKEIQKQLDAGSLHRCDEDAAETCGRGDVLQDGPSLDKPCGGICIQCGSRAARDRGRVRRLSEIYRDQ